MIYQDPVETNSAIVSILLLFLHNWRRFFCFSYVSIALNFFTTPLPMFRHPCLHNLGQLSHLYLQPPVGSNTDVGETQTHLSVATLKGSNQY